MIRGDKVTAFGLFKIQMLGILSNKLKEGSKTVMLKFMINGEMYFALFTLNIYFSCKISCIKLILGGLIQFINHF